MPLIDDQGRLFGRLNLVDSAAAVFLLLLVPLAYGTYRLFRPVTPAIESVQRVAITREERRLAGGVELSAKLKVRGSGFNPMLRASIGEEQAVGYVFENPNSADVLVGRLAPGTHDLVLWDGVQEVARARGAVAIETTSRLVVRLAGRLLELNPAVAHALTPSGSEPPPDANVVVAALGPVEPGRVRLQVGDRVMDTLHDGAVERDAIVVVRCDPPIWAGPCTIAGQSLTDDPPPVISLTTPRGVLKLAVHDVLPVTPAHSALARVTFSGGPELAGLQVGDRDRLLDDRAAVITEVTRRSAAGGASEVVVLLRLGVDASREGWRYRGRLVIPGAAFTLTTPRYLASGSVHEITPIGSPGETR